MDSEFDRRVAANVPTGMPGRGQVPEKLHFLGALPRIDGSPEAESLSEGTAEFVAAVRAGWPGPSAPGVRLLPRLLHADQLPKGGEFPERGIAIGIDETALEPVFVDFESDPFFLVFGESESGKTNLLRLIARQIAERYPPEQAKLVVGDYRRGLLGALPEEHLLEYAPMANSLQTHMQALAGVFSRRQPPADVTPQQLRDRSWWTGPNVFIVIDDYDLVATSQGNPLAPLVEFLPSPGTPGSGSSSRGARRGPRGPCTSRSCSGSRSWGRRAWCCRAIRPRATCSARSARARCLRGVATTSRAGGAPRWCSWGGCRGCRGGGPGGAGWRPGGAGWRPGFDFRRKRPRGAGPHR